MIVFLLRAAVAALALWVADELFAGIRFDSGAQLVILGLVGEYLGRMFLTVNQRPQSVVRETIASN